MSDTEYSEPKKSIFDKFTKKNVDEFLESLLIIVVACLSIFFYPMIRWYVIEGVTLAKCYYNPPDGHGKSLGGHQAPDIGRLTAVKAWPTPDTFFDDYVAESKPLILQGLAATFPAFKLWTDEYLNENIGTKEVHTKIENGTVTWNKMDWFLENYSQNRIHLLTPIPEKIIGDLLVPETTKCGNFPSALDQVLVWMNGEDVTLGLNVDTRDTILCSLTGRQFLILIDRLQYELAKKVASESLENRKMDLCRNRDIRKISWINATLEAGDCLYLPSRWHKEISFSDSRNLGVSFLYFRLLFFNQSDCLQPKGQKSKPSKEELLKYEIISLAENHATLDLFNFKKVFYMPGINNEKTLVELFSILDADNDNEVLPEDLYSLQTDEFLKFFPGFSARGTERYNHIQLDEFIPAEEALLREMERYEEDEDY